MRTDYPIVLAHNLERLLWHLKPHGPDQRGNSRPSFICTLHIVLYPWLDWHHTHDTHLFISLLELIAFQAWNWWNSVKCAFFCLSLLYRHVCFSVVNNTIFRKPGFLSTSELGLGGRLHLHSFKETHKHKYAWVQFHTHVQVLVSAWSFGLLFAASFKLLFKMLPDWMCLFCFQYKASTLKIWIR